MCCQLDTSAMQVHLTMSNVALMVEACGETIVEGCSAG